MNSYTTEFLIYIDKARITMGMVNELQNMNPIERKEILDEVEKHITRLIECSNDLKETFNTK